MGKPNIRVEDAVLDDLSTPEGRAAHDLLSTRLDEPTGEPVARPRRTSRTTNLEYALLDYELADGELFSWIARK